MPERTTPGHAATYLVATLALAALWTPVAADNTVVKTLATRTFGAPPAQSVAAGPVASIEFSRPARGWVHLRLDATVGEGQAVALTLDDVPRDEAILAGAGETMRHVEAGRHTLRVWVDGTPVLRQLTVRSVPEIMVYMFEALQTPAPQLYYIHPWEFFEQYMLDSCNMIVSPYNDAYGPYAEMWRARGGKWVGNQGMATLRKADTDAVEYWTGLLGNAVFDGVIHDELLATDVPHYARYADALNRLAEVPVAGEKTVYFYGGTRIIPDLANTRYFLLDETQAFESSTSLRCIPFADEALTIRQYELKLEPGKTYTLSAHFRTRGVKSSTYTGIFIINDGWYSTNNSMLRPPNGDTEWQRYTKTFAPDASRNGLYQLVVCPPEDGELWIDAVQLEEGGAATDFTATDRRNMLRNAGFEAGYEGWMDNLTQLRPFVDAVLQHGHWFAPEFYRNEAATEEQAREAISKHLTNVVAQWAAYREDVMEHVMIVFSAGNGSIRYSNDRFPDVSYKVLLDMQFHALANEPAFEGLGGIGFWSGHYIDEELMRFYAALFRHYCIEGNTERFTDDPYQMDHLANGGFEAGTEGWTLSPAAGGTIEVVAAAAMPRPEVGERRGTYSPLPEGRSVLHTVRRGATANSISQRIRNLTPGRLYSVRVHNTSPEQDDTSLPVIIDLDNAEVLADRSLDHVWQRGEVHWNYHYRVFRATAPQTQLTISDGAPYEAYWDFVAVDPYFEQ